MTLRMRIVTLILITLAATTGAHAANPKWAVTWLGNVNLETSVYRIDGTADKTLANMLTKVLGVDVPSVPWEQADADNLFLITSKENAPPDIAAKLDGKKPDAFLIQYPVQFKGKTVCILVSQDDKAYDYPVYEFLRRVLNVEWVGPGEIGEVYTPQPDWTLPEQLYIFDEPDYIMRLWSGQSFSSRPWLARQSRMSFHHALGVVFAPSKYAESDPDVYPLIDGKRLVPDPTKTHSSGWQPCLFNPKSIKIATDYVKEQMAKGQIAASLSVNDGAGNHCQCNLCTAQDTKLPRRSAWDLSDRYFRFYNKVMEDVLKEYPDGHIAVLAYGPTSQPPQETRINSHILTLKVAATPKELREWGDAGAAPNLYMWLWDGGFLTVRPDMHPIAKQVRTCHDLGGFALYSEIIANWVVSAPKFYVLANLLWDTSRDVDQLLNHYCHTAYGNNAGPAVERYFSRWWKIYMRFDDPYRTVHGWRNTEQFEHLTRADLLVLNDAINEAQAADMTQRQRTRLGFLKTYHQWMMLNAEQWLTAQDMQNPQWIADHSAEGILNALDAAHDITPQFTAMWNDVIYPDKTGWLIDMNYSKADPAQRRDYWGSFTGQLRTMVDSAFESAAYDALCAVSDRMSKPDAMAYWQDARQQRSHLATWIDAQIRRLNGEGGTNVVINGNFENSKQGDPPIIEGWKVYEQYGMVEGVHSKYAFTKGSGRDGSIAAGMGHGAYPELRSFAKLEAGKRYRLSFWYKTEKYERDGKFFIYRVKGGMNKTRPDVERFFAQGLEPTDGRWQRVVRILSVEHTSDYMIMLSFYHVGENEWVRFDDIELLPL